MTLGGLVGANAGFITGQALLRAELVEPRDFGWLSLLGAAGTVVGGGVGAVFSTRTNPQPVLAGLAIGPAVGLASGALLLPRLRTLGTGTSSASAPIWMRRRVVAGFSSAESLTSADVLAPKGRGGVSLRRRLRSLVDVVAWTPVVGALPEAPGTHRPGPPPLTLGVAGLLR